MAEIPCLVPEAPRLVSVRYRRGPRRLRGGHQPLAGPRPRRRPRGLAGASRAGAPAEALPGTEAIDPRTPLARAGGVWLPRPGLDLRPRRQGHRGGVRRPLPQGPRQPVAQGAALDAPAADQAGHPAGRGGHPALAGRDLAGAASARPPRAPGPRFRGRIGLLPPARGGQDLRPRGADPGPPREADARPPLRHGGDDAGGTGLHHGPAGVAQRAALHRVPPALAPRGGGSPAGDLGRLADPSAGRRSRSSWRARAAGCGWRPCRAMPPT